MLDKICTELRLKIYHYCHPAQVLPELRLTSKALREEITSPVVAEAWEHYDQAQSEFPHRARLWAERRLRELDRPVNAKTIYQRLTAFEDMQACLKRADITTQIFKKNVEIKQLDAPVVDYVEDIQKNYGVVFASENKAELQYLGALMVLLPVGERDKMPSLYARYYAIASSKDARDCAKHLEVNIDGVAVPPKKDADEDNMAYWPLAAVFEHFNTAENKAAFAVLPMHE